MQGATDDGRLVRVLSEKDVFEVYRGGPIEDLLLAQNGGRDFPVGAAPALLVATCMDSRVRLKLPPGAAYELRSAGVNLKENAFFQIAFAVSVVGVRHIAVVSHDDCAMTSLASKQRAFAEGMAQHTGWSESKALTFFQEQAGFWGQEDAVATVTEYARTLRSRFPSATIAPLHYSVSGGDLSQIDEGSSR